ncbi:MAG: nicotinate-nucleotide--dimethylbenzimidazole phosphoribosyltransferase [Desulfovibrio sp.]|jgi:nicotinate-nucleotide--dimethylbenzimidazole phosphoribosyltransferase|nr:nicotinate-nucleotide--dimethylbenzimidazole phosphoribosyltransferase [Desulfovibrio sp.]
MKHPSAEIRPVEKKYLDTARTRLDELTKPRGSLGRLEDVAAQLFAIGRGRFPLVVEPAVMLVVAGDHGVAAQGVSPVPQSVTRQMVHNFLNGGAAINAFCRGAGMSLLVVDAGCAGGTFGSHPLLLDRRLGDGTADISRGPAMSRELCLRGIEDGIAIAGRCAAQGYMGIGAGEMGIANSTVAAALYCALLGLDPEAVVGPGAGADAAMQRRKIEIVRQALHVNAGQARENDPVGVLAALGGFEIAVLCGIVLGSAAERLPVLIDGFICCAAYAAALKMCPDAAGYAILAHTSAERGHKAALQNLAPGRPPLLDLGMRLGEGTGAAAAYPLVRCAAAMYNEMATFDSAGVVL